MTQRLLALLGVAAGLVSTARAAEEPAEPELDLLEYLGSWQADDEEWVIEAGWEDEAEEAVSPADGKPEPEAEPEGTDDEP